METTNNILVTRELNEAQIAFARELGLNPLIRPAIHASFPEPDEKILSLADHYSGAPWVFTSKNGVKGFFELENSPEPVAGLIRELKEKQPEIYAVGKKTAEALLEIGLKARVPDHQYAVGLAELIIQDLAGTGASATPSISASAAKGADNITGPVGEAGEAGEAGEDLKSDSDISGNRADKAVIHWCGNRSRKELGSLLDKAGIRLAQQVVYHTNLNECTLPETPVDAILFFSPSAVEAFRQSVGFNRELPELFAIGTTTAEALSLESGANIHIPSEPSTEHLLELSADILNSLKQA